MKEQSADTTDLDKVFLVEYRKHYRLFRDKYLDELNADDDLNLNAAREVAQAAISALVEKTFMTRGETSMQMNPHLQLVADHFMQKARLYDRNRVTNYFDKRYRTWMEEKLEWFRTYMHESAPNKNSLNWTNEEVVDHLAFRCASQRVRERFDSYITRTRRQPTPPVAKIEPTAPEQVHADIVVAEETGDTVRLTAAQATLLMYRLMNDAGWKISGNRAIRVQEFLSKLTGYSMDTLKPFVLKQHSDVNRYVVPERQNMRRALRNDLEKIRAALKPIGVELPVELEQFDSDLEDAINEQIQKELMNK